MKFSEMFKSRKLWMTLGSIAASTVSPEVAELAPALTGSYLGGQGVADSNGEVKKKKKRWKSRKLWMTIGGFALGALFPPALPVLKFLIPAYNLSQGVADSGLISAFAGKK